MTGCMPTFRTNWPFVSAGLTAKALAFVLLIAQRTMVGGKTSPGKAKIFPDISTSVTLSLGLETGLSRLINTLQKCMNLQLGK